MFERFVLISPLPGNAAHDRWTVTDLQTHEGCELELYPPVALTVPAWTENLKRAATTASQIQYPHLARLLDLRITPQFTAAIWSGGAEQDLGSLIKSEADGRIAFPRAAVWLEQLAGALDHLHAATGSAHGSLCPRRIQVAADGAVRVAHACVINTLRDIVLHSGGTWESTDELPYLSPQRWGGAPVSPADDVYAFGCIAYAVLTGNPPFHQGDIAAQAQTTAVTPIFLQQTAQGVSIDDVPAPWQAFIDACLTKDAAKRPLALLPLLQSAIQQSAPPAAPSFPFGGSPPSFPQGFAPVASGAASLPPLPALPPTPFEAPAATPAAPAPPPPTREEIPVTPPPPVATPPAPTPEPAPTPPVAQPPPAPPQPAPPPPAVSSAPAPAPVPAPAPPAASVSSAPTPAPAPKPAAVKPAAKAEEYDPYSKHSTPPKPGSNARNIALAAAALIVAVGGWYFWQNWSAARAIRDQAQAKITQAQEMLNTEREADALRLLREALVITPQDTEISGQIQRIEERALIREFEDYNNELKKNGSLQNEVSARVLIEQTLARDPTHASARALKLNLEIQQERLAAARKAAEATAAAEARAAAVAATRAAENATAQAETELARRKLEISELKLLVLRANTPERSFAARNALDQLRLLAPNDPDLADLEARLRDPAKSAAQPAVINMDTPADDAQKTTPSTSGPRAAVQARPTSARLLSGKPPDYPRELLRTQRGGEVDVSFTVDVDGSVKDPKIIRSSHADFSAAVLKVVRTYRFEPATVNGKPTSSQVAMPFNFTP